MGSVCTFIECLKPLVYPDIFSCKYCGFKYCAEHKQPENHSCGKPSYVKYVRKTWLRKYEQNISSGQYIVVCDTCGYTSSEPQLIDLAGRELEAHLTNNGTCSTKNTFLEEVLAPDVFKTLANQRENIVHDNRPFWVCAHCRPPQKFKTRDEYIAHHFVHS